MSEIRLSGAPPGNGNAPAGEARAIPRILLGGGVDANHTDTPWSKPLSLIHI